MKLVHPRHFTTAAIYATLATLLLIWIGSYLSWRRTSVAARTSSLVNRVVLVPESLPEPVEFLFEPLAKIDGWISRETVTLGRASLIYIKDTVYDLPEIPPQFSTVK